MKAVALLLLLGVLGAVQAAPGSPVATIAAEKDLTLFAKLVEFAGIKTVLSDPKAKVTLLAPTDKAIEAFLKAMGLTAADLGKSKALAAAIAGYHIVLGQAAGPKELFAKGDSIAVPTADLGYKVTFKKAAGGVTVTDVQGNVAKVARANLGGGAHAVHVIDKVLYSGSYFTDLAAVVKLLPGMFSTVVEVADKAGLASTLTAKGFSDTLFLPTNKAFAAANVGGADAAKLKDVLMYHVVPGTRLIPGGFKSGEPVETKLAGQTITVTYAKEGKVAGLTTSRAFVTDGQGKKVMVIKPNLFISKATGQVIDGVLLPAAAAAAEPKAEEPVTEEPAAAEPKAEEPAAEPKAEEPKAEEPAAAEPKAEEPAAEPKAEEPAAEPKAEEPKAEAKPAATATKTVTKTATVTKSSDAGVVTIKHGPLSITLKGFGKGGSLTIGRKMLQVGEDDQFANTISEDSTSQAILQAVNSGGDYGATTAAAQGGVANAEVESLWPEHSTYADGIAGSIAGIKSGGN